MQSRSRLAAARSMHVALSMHVASDLTQNKLQVAWHKKSCIHDE